MAATAVHVPVSDYPLPLSENGLAVEYLTGNHSHDIPTETYDNEVKALLKKLESKPGFDKNLKFDPKKHIIFKEEDFDKVKTFTLQDLKIEKTHCKTHSDFGATFPFPLINQEACDMLISMLVVILMLLHSQKVYGIVLKLEKSLKDFTVFQLLQFMILKLLTLTFL
ncbi:unnamed protein product [[Candida] boidinii]|nr:unnamed protein product [[Candida] boidinii]